MTKTEINELRFAAADANTIAKRAGLREGQISDLQDRVMRYVLDRHGVVVGQAEIILQTQISGAAINVPVGPVLCITEVTVNGCVSDQWRLRPSGLYLPAELKGKLVTVHYLAGFAGEVPQMILAAMAILCQHWASSNAEPTPSVRAEIAQRVALFTPLKGGRS
jgi:hypothetical protein